MAASEDRGFTLLELLTVVALIGILSMLGMAGLVAARKAANEASAIASLRAIAIAQQAYATTCANGYYASSLPILASAPPGGSPFIPPDLGAASTVDKSGYLITLARGTDSTPASRPACNPLGAAADLVNSYYATADPRNGFTGSRHFWTNAQSVIFYNRDAPIQHRAALTTPSAPTLEGESSAGGVGGGKATDGPGADPPRPDPKDEPPPGSSESASPATLKKSTPERR